MHKALRFVLLSFVFQHLSAFVYAQGTVLCAVEFRVSTFISVGVCTEHCTLSGEWKSMIITATADAF